MGQRFNSDDADLDMEIALQELGRFESDLVGDVDENEIIEVCTNCGAYHTEPHNRCRKCQEI